MTTLASALARLAGALSRHLELLRIRGRTPATDALGGLAIEAGDAEGILAELAVTPRAAPVATELLSDGLESFAHAASTFGLSPFERDALLLALAPELDARFCRIFGYLNDSVVALRPTVGLAAALLAPSAGPNALVQFLPTGRLVRSGLLVTNGDSPLAARAIRISADVWPRLADLAAPVPSAFAYVVAPAAARVADRAAELADLVLAPATRARAATALRLAQSSPARPLVLVHGAHGRDALAAAIARELGTAAVLAATTANDTESRRTFVRDARWDSAVIAVERGATLETLCELCRDAGRAVVAAVDAEQLPALARVPGRFVIDVSIEPLDDADRGALWRHHGAADAGLDVAQHAARYRFEPGRVASTMALARTRAASREAALTAEDVLDACRTLGGAGGSKLAQRLDTPFAIEDLVVSTATRRELDLLATATRDGHRLFRSGSTGARVRGTTGFVALFAGPSGTGKTMAAQVVARDLGVELLRVDLSQVVNKYIGETEKHLDLVFSEAAASSAILFFDEADALFGRRTDVRDAHDRYANLETAYLLQRLEQHPGVCVLATNLKRNLDPAFMRRLHFVIDFAIPEAPERRAIWDRHLAHTPLQRDVDADFLARFELSGGDIRNAVITAILLGADDPELAMPHLVVAAARELRKAGRLSQPRDFGEWTGDVVTHLIGSVPVDAPS